MSQAALTPQSVAQLQRLTESDPDRARHGLSPTAWLKIGVLTLLVAAIFWSSLARLWHKTNPIYGEGNWGHAFIVPLVGLYYLYLNRDALLRAPIVPILPGRWTRRQVLLGAAIGLGGLLATFVIAPTFSGSLRPYVTVAGYALAIYGGLVLLLNWGVGTLVGGLLTFGFGIWPGQNDYVKDLGLVITIFGIVLTQCGWAVMKIAWFPIAFLICALPWPGLVYSWVAGPLQQLAATVAVVVLNLTGVDALQSGTKIVIPTNDPLAPRILNVAEACAGLRSLMTFITLGASLAFLSSRPLWQKLFITAMAVPVAILCNVMRVAGQGLLDTYVSQELAEGFAHQFVGMIMLIPAFFMLLGVVWLVDQIFVEEAEAKAVAAARAASKDRVVRKKTPADGTSAGSTGAMPQPGELS